MCPALVDIGNGTVNTTLAIYGVVVEAVCDEGHHFSKNITAIVVGCLHTGEWTEQLTECQGMYVIQEGGLNSLQNVRLCMLYRTVD